jgi:hypothetical protein
VRPADVVVGEDAEERWRDVGRDFGEGALDVQAAALFAVDQAEDSGDGHAGVAGSFDGGDGGAAGGANVVDDDNGGAGMEEAFDAAAGAVSLLGLADEEAVDEGGLGAVLFFEFEISGGSAPMVRPPTATALGMCWRMRS